MGQNRAFGNPRDITGKAGTFQSTLVPLDLLGHMLTRPIPISVSGSSNVTFTVNASVSNPVYIWDGNDFIALKETLSHTMANAATNAGIVAATGVYSAALTPGAVGVKYYYLGLDTAGALTLAYSDGAPSYVEGPFPGTVLGHPGTARDRMWRYVGFSFMSATTPAFDNFTKVGNCYAFSNHAYAGVDTQPGAVTLSVVPAINGIRIGGYVTGAATGQAVELGLATSATLTNAVIGSWKAQPMGATAPAGTTAVSPVPFASFDHLQVTSAGDIVAHIEATATTVNIVVTKVYDVV